jgi:hypothetical protein
VLVIIGPFNQHMIAPDQRPLFEAMQSNAAAALRQRGVAVIVPATLPSALYADASHPLTGGYELLARRLWNDSVFAQWLRK